MFRRRLGTCRYLTAAFLLAAGLLTSSRATAQGEVLAIAGAIKAGYGAYKDMLSLLTSGDPTQQDQMLAKLTALENDYKQIHVELDQINKKIEEEIQLDRRAYFLENLKQVEIIRALARTGAEEIALWVQGRKQNAALLSQAEHDSLYAASQMLEGKAFFLRPGQGDTEFVFDYRSALPAYLYVMTVRQGVVSLAEPGFRANPVCQNEFGQHVKRLDEILADIDLPLSCAQSGSLPPDSDGFYDICSHCSDPITGAISFINGEYPRPLVPTCENPLKGSAQDYADGLSFFAFYDRYRTQEKVGYVDLRNLRDLVETNTHSSRVETYHQYRALIGYGGKCLTSHSGWPSQGGWPPDMEPCDGSPAQEWQRDSYGALRSLDRCLQVHRFETSNGATLEPDDCSRAPGERWTLTTAGDIRGIGGKCLEVKDFSTAARAPVQMWDCWGGANQQWSWTAPPGPAITSIDPSSGPIAGGTYVHITGSGFDPNAPSNNMQAFFGGVPSDYVLCEDSTRCTVRSPKFAAPGPAYIDVKVSGIFSMETALFLYHAHPVLTGIGWDWFDRTIGVFLDGYAPDGGTTVAVSSSDPTALSVPASVTIPAGSSGATVPVQVLPIPSAETVIVTASYDGVALSTNVSLAAWPPLSINLGVASALAAGASSTATVSLNSPAPVEGAVVALASSDSSAIPVPASLTVPAGQKTAAFMITDHYSGAPEQVTIRATYYGLAASDALYVPQEPTCHPHACPTGSHWDPDSCECARGLPQ